MTYTQKCKNMNVYPPYTIDRYLKPIVYYQITLM